MNGSRAWFEKDFYKVLGVPEGASSDDIRRAYRRLARQYHPDHNPGDRAAEERMKDASEAYDVLSDPKKRAEYDDVRRMATSGYRGFGPGGGRRVRVDGMPFDFEGVFGDLFGASGGGGRRRRGARGADLETAVEIPFEQAARGGTVPVRFERDAPCAECGGSGSRSGVTPVCSACGGSGSVGEDQGLFSFLRPCPQCGGSGRLRGDCPACRGTGAKRAREEVKVRVPAGIADGARIRVRGRGEFAPGAAPGDLYVTVRVAPHPVFGRRGADLTLTVPVSFTEAALGATLKVPTLGGGSISLKVPAGTPSGKTLRARGHGLPKKGDRGDLLVTVQVVVPEKLSKKEKALLEELASLQDASPRAHLGV